MTYFFIHLQGNSSYWCSDLLKASEEFLSSVTLTQDSIDEELLTRHLFTVGEVAQVCGPSFEGLKDFYRTFFEIVTKTESN